MQFDVAAVTKRAEEALVRNLNNPEESRGIYSEELFDWSDYYTERLSKTPDSEEARHAMSRIVQLRIAYCTMEVNLKQFKKATTIYDDSLKDPVVNRLADIYLAYVEYCTSRGKSTSAQNVFLKGLSAGLQQVEADKLWSKFLSFIQAQQQTPDLTVEQLYEDVRINAGVDALTPPGSLVMKSDHVSSSSDGCVTLHEETKSIEGIPVVVAMDTSDANTPPFSSLSAHELLSRSHASPVLSAVLEIDRSMVAAETKDGDETVIETTKTATSSSSSATTASSSNVGAESSGGIGRISPAIPTGDDLDSVTGMTPELLCRMYRSRPPMLFSALNREPTLRGLSLLRSEEITELESFLGEKLTGIQYSEKRGPSDRYLDLVEALWTAQALKERHFDYWFTETKKVYDAEETELRRTLSDRENKIGLSGPALADMKSKNQIEWQRFSNRRAVQMEVLNAVVNKTIFSMLLEQQRAFLAAGFPRFSMGTIERLENTVNSLRSTVSSSSSGSGTSPDFDAALVQEVAGQRAYICALLSLRVNYKALRNASITTTGGGSGSHTSASSSGSSSASSSGSRFWVVAGRRGVAEDQHLEGEDDYYSRDAKLMRKAKRRRLSDSSGGDSPYSVGSQRSGGGGGGGGGIAGGNMSAIRGYGASGGSGLSIPAPAAQKTGIVAAMEKDRLAAVRVQPPTGAAAEELLQKLTNLSSVMQKLKK